MDMKNQPNKATVKDGLPTAKKVLAKHYDVDNRVDEAVIVYAMKEYSDQQNAELLAWKESAMRELNALDLQSLGTKLGIGLGQSISENVHTKVDGLLERVKELERLLTIWVKQNNYLRRHSISDFDEVHDQTKKALKK